MLLVSLHPFNAGENENVHQGVLGQDLWDCEKRRGEEYGKIFKTVPDRFRHEKYPSKCYRRECQRYACTFLDAGKQRIFGIRFLVH